MCILLKILRKRYGSEQVVPIDIGIWQKLPLQNHSENNFVTSFHFYHLKSENAVFSVAARCQGSFFRFYSRTSGSSGTASFRW